MFSALNNEITYNFFVILQTCTVISVVAAGTSKIPRQWGEDYFNPDKHFRMGSVFLRFDSSTSLLLTMTFPAMRYFPPDF